MNSPLPIWFQQSMVRSLESLTLPMSCLKLDFLAIFQFFRGLLAIFRLMPMQAAFPLTCLVTCVIGLLSFIGASNPLTLVLVFNRCTCPQNVGYVCIF